LLSILGLGDNVCDIYLHTKMMYPGGQALNVAVFSARLGAHAEYLGVFGTDDAARHIKGTLDALKVPYPRSREYGGENGYAKVTVVEGDRIFRGSNRGGPIQDHPIVLDEEDLGYIGEFDVVHTTNNSFLDAELPKLAALPCVVSYDFSFRWDEDDRLERVCPFIDIGFLSCGGAGRERAEEICRRIRQRGCATAVATMGKEGALLFDGENLLCRPTDPQPALDTLGAGDGFAAALLVAAVGGRKKNPSRWTKDAALRKEVYTGALAKAAAFATEVCMVSGAFGRGIVAPDSIWNIVSTRRERNAP
jgi:sugar/nucleoside kinase (ribokinase family)